MLAVLLWPMWWVCVFASSLVLMKCGIYSKLILIIFFHHLLRSLVSFALKSLSHFSSMWIILFFYFRFLCWPRSQMPSVSSLHEYGPIGTRFNDFIIYSRFSFPIGAHSAAAGCYCWCCCKGTTNDQKRLADNIAIERTICIMKAPLNHHPHHDADQIWSLAHTQTQKYWR